MVKPKVIMLSEPTLNTTLMLIEGGTWEQSKEVCEEFGIVVNPDEIEQSTSQAYYMKVNPKMHKKGYEFNVIWWDGVRLKSLVHEIVHLVTSTFDERNIPISRDNDETLAYQIAYWYWVTTEKIRMPEEKEIKLTKGKK